MLNKQNHREHDQARPRRKRAAIYLCRWGDGEVDRSNRPSIKTQRRICHLEAKNLNAEIVDEFVDAANAPLPPIGMQGLVDRLEEEPRLDYLIVYSLDKLVRQRKTAFEIGWLLASASTVLVSWAHAYESTFKQQTVD